MEHWVDLSLKGQEALKLAQVEGHRVYSLILDHTLKLVACLQEENYKHLMKQGIGSEEVQLEAVKRVGHSQEAGSVD